MFNWDLLTHALFSNWNKVLLSTLSPTPIRVNIINVWSLTCFYDQISIVVLSIHCLSCNYLRKIILNENIQVSLLYKVFSEMHFISKRKLSAWSCHFKVCEKLPIGKLTGKLPIFFLYSHSPIFFYKKITPPCTIPHHRYIV